MSSDSNPEQRNKTRKFSFYGEGVQLGYSKPPDTFFWMQTGRGDVAENELNHRSSPGAQKIIRIGNGNQIIILFEWRISE